MNNNFWQRLVLKNYMKKKELEDTGRILIIDVSFDGTWLTRGHKSHIGAAFIIEIPSGLALDFEVLSNYSRLCSINKKKKDKEFRGMAENSHRKVPPELLRALWCHGGRRSS